MLKYFFKIPNPHNHFIDVSIQLGVENLSAVSFQLPSWRPGRYELGDFAKKIKDFNAFNENSNELSFNKLTKDKWQIDTSESMFVTVNYKYYANELNAGSTFLDDSQLYVNPINCCMYTDFGIDQRCEISLELPENYSVVSSLQQLNGTNRFAAENFHELVDSPFICGNSIKRYSYTSNKTTFHLCFQGEVKPDENKLITDFKKFTDFQIELFGAFPSDEYYFLFQITPYNSYHGVEHQKSTVILLGPSYDIFNKKYDSLLGIASHELYHTWNVKTIRPVDMLPYDYAEENYTHMGYVTEGVTTYMGDRILFESGVFTLKNYFRELENLLTRHFHNDGRKHYSVAESSFDTWLDGYISGIPGRKVSIYVEGALVALICDARIRECTNDTSSLHTVLKQMYSGNKKLSGYDRNSYQALLEKVAGQSFNDIFDQLIYGKNDFSPYLEKAFQFWGWKYKKIPSNKALERYGIKASWSNGSYCISSVLEESSAYKSGLVNDDKIHSVNGFKLNGDINQWLDYFSGDEIVISFQRGGLLKRTSLLPINDHQYYVYKMLLDE